MKKLSIIIVVIIQFGHASSFGQDNFMNRENKPQRFCVMKVTTMDYSKNSYIFHHFSNDSLFAITFTETENGFQLHDQVAFKAENIRRVYVKAKKQIILPDPGIRADSSDKETQDSMARQINKLNTRQELVGAAIDLAFFDLETALFSFGIGMLFGSNGVTYYIKGNEKEFKRMTKELTRKK